MELIRLKGVATRIVFPLKNGTGALLSGCTGLDSEIDTYSDSVAPDGFVDCSNEATEIGTSGHYYLVLTAAEMNFSYIIVQIKSVEAKTQTVIIKTMELIIGVQI